MAAGDYRSKLADSLNALRNDNQLCDICIKVGVRSFNAHKAVLAASSSYFKAMFTSGFKESSESEISIDGDPDSFEVLLDYAYTGDLTITPKTAYSILEMACYMQFTDIYQHCCKLIQFEKFESSAAKIGDVVKIYILSECHASLKEITEGAIKYLSAHFLELKSDKVLLESTSESFMKQLLEQQDLAIEEDGEKEVCNGQNKYVDYYVFTWFDG